MSRTMQTTLVKSSIGRIIIHIAGIYRDGKLAWHIKGIKREFRIDFA